MKKLSLLFLVAGCVLAQTRIPGPGGASGKSAFVFSRTVTLLHVKAGSSNSLNYPFWFHSPQGTVNTTNVTNSVVTLASGDAIFPSWMSSGPIMINGTVYTISSQTDSTHLVLTTNAGANTGVAFSGTPWLATVGSGGKVQHTVTQTGAGQSITIPADVIFTSDSSCKVPLAGWEWQAYNSGTGAADARVNVGTLSSSVDTLATQCYDATSISTQQMTTCNTWDSSTGRMYGLGNGTTLSAVNSQCTTDTGAITTATATTGQVDGGAGGFNGSSAKILVTGTAVAGPFTIWAWIHPTNCSATRSIIGGGSGSVGLRIDTGCHIFITRTAAADDTAATTAVSTGVWSLVVAIQDGSGNYAYYVNGAAAGSFTGGQTAFSGNITGIGTNPGLSEFFLGSLDEIEWDSTNRSADRVTARFNNESTPGTFFTISSEITN